MCGRYTITVLARQLMQRFRAEMFEEVIDALSRPRYNAAPTQRLPVITSEPLRRLDALRWGLIPSWSKDAQIGNRLINARIETLAEKPSFRNALKKRRCLVPADGYYEWKKTPRGKQPMRITPAEGGVVAFAGLWETWKPPDGEPIRSFTIVTTAAAESVREIHDRMPVILDAAMEDRWLDPAEDPPKLLPDILASVVTEFDARPVSRRVNSPSNDDPDVLRPDDAPST